MERGKAAKLKESPRKKEGGKMKLSTLMAIKGVIVLVFGIGFVVALIGQLSGLVNALGWLTVALYFFLAIGFGYHALKKPKTA
jgi:hypothetical protein